MSLDRRLWTDEQDQHILRLVQKYGTKKWPIISQKLCNQTQFERTGKQCRQRWYNHLNPQINNSNWSEQDEQKLFEAHQHYGNKWKYISRQFPGRTDNSIKNHFYSTIRKCLRRINKLHGEKNSTMKMRNIKPYVLSKILADKNLTEVILELGKTKPNKMKKQSKLFNLQQLNERIQKLYLLNEQYQQKKNKKKNDKKFSHDFVSEISQNQSDKESEQLQKVEISQKEDDKQIIKSQRSERSQEMEQYVLQEKKQKLENHIYSFKKRKRINHYIKLEQNTPKSYNYQQLNEVLKKDEFKRYKKCLNYMKLNDGILCETQRHSSLDETNYEISSNKKIFEKSCDNLFEDQQQQQRQYSIQQQNNQSSKDMQFKSIFNHDFLQAHSIGNIHLSNPSPSFSKNNSSLYQDLIIIGTHIKIFHNLDGQMQKINSQISKQSVLRNESREDQFIQQILQINFDDKHMFESQVIEEMSEEKQ